VVDLIDACEKGKPRVRLAAIQACRSLFMLWADVGELLVRPPAEVASSNASEEGGEVGGVLRASPQSIGAQSSALDTYRLWLREKYTRFLGALRRVLQSGKTPLALRPAALDSLLLMAAVEVRCARPGRGLHLAALDNASGAFREMVTVSRAPQPHGHQAAPAAGFPGAHFTADSLATVIAFQHSPYLLSGNGSHADRPSCAQPTFQRK
jgi:hypothetical protein